MLHFLKILNVYMNLKQRLNKPIVIVGLMGAGKTSIGKRLAKYFELPFIDSDYEIEKSAGASIVDIFSMYGEQEFRRVEEKIINKILSDNKVQIISTGEGAFIIDKVRKQTKERAITLWLKADLQLLVKRTSLKNTRPLLLNDNPSKILNKLINERYPIYAESDIVVETKDEPAYKTIQNILIAIDGFLAK